MDENYLKRLADMQTQTKELVPDSLKENGERRIRQDDTYEFIGVWDERYKRVGFEADIEGRPIEQLIRCKDCKYSDTFSDMTAEPHSQLKCLGIRYGGVEPMWYCEHAERKEE